MQRRLILITGFTLLLVLSCVTALAAPIIVKDGCRGHAVLTVQRLLIAQGYLDDAADGVAGPKTVAAIKAFQQASGLEADGICGGATFAVLSGGVEYNAPAGHELDYCETHGDHFHPRKAPRAAARLPQAPVYSLEENERIAELVSRGAGRTLYVEATAYSPFDSDTCSRTATGEVLRRGLIAVDPTVIPLGTEVYIPGYGAARAADTGGSIKGHIIDIAFDTYEEAIAFGRRNLEIYVID